VKQFFYDNGFFYKHITIQNDNNIIEEKLSQRKDIKINNESYSILNRKVIVLRKTTLKFDKRIKPVPNYA
jgi:hypothetical protein